jgi:alkanesulfonate monooxygenase SsuD/methylene tetrahydromethanopterin reductase-like flavin-dependent oxidoreductase (luciferase family)
MNSTVKARDDRHSNHESSPVGSRLAVPAYRIGLSGCAGGLEAISSSGVLNLAEKAESLGFDALWLNEEHFQGSIVDVEGRRCHSPLILASAILARTQKLRVGFSVLLLSLHHPFRLAEEIATLDVISDGRVDFGISRGGNGRYLEVFGITPDNVNDRFYSSLQFMREAWQDGKMSFGANSYSIEPKPIQKPHPPIYIGTYSDETVAWTAREGHTLICHGITNMANQRRLIRAFQDAGGDVRGVPFGRFVYVSESDESARAELWPTVLKLTKRLTGIGLFNRKGILAERDLEPENFYREMVIAGSPESCAQQLVELHDDLGVTYLNGLSAFFGFLPLELLDRSLTLLGREVRPRVESALKAKAVS